MNNFKEYLKLAKNKFFERLLVALSMLMLANLILFPCPVLADGKGANNGKGAFNFDYNLVKEEQINRIIKILNPEVLFANNSLNNEDEHLPENKSLTFKYSAKVMLSAYNSESGQTDSSPCLTANGFNVCKHGKEDTVAINGVKLGTKVRFPELFGDRVFVVRDRMNSRYNSGHVDVWMLSKIDAKKFGVKVARMEVLE
jgi:3D (Asp-Asp-Asp) domain-containing protein